MRKAIMALALALVALCLCSAPVRADLAGSRAMRHQERLCAHKHRGLVRRGLTEAEIATLARLGCRPDGSSGLVFTADEP